MIPTKGGQTPDPAFDRATYRRRSAVERRAGRLKEHRRLATRYDEPARSFLAFARLAAILMWM